MSATFSITFTHKGGERWDIVRCVKAKNGTQEEIDVAMELNNLIRAKIIDVGGEGVSASAGGLPDWQEGGGEWE